MARTRHGLPGIYNSSPITLSNEEGAALALDVNGYVKVNIAAGSVGASTVDQSTFTSSTTTGTITMGVYQATPDTIADGKAGAIAIDTNRNVKVTMATQLAGEDLVNDVIKVEERFSYLNIAAGQATTVVKSGAGFLHSITFNSAATATNVTTVYDNTAGSGTVIAIPAATTATVPTTLMYDVSFATGLTILTATANGSNMTVSYR